MAPAVVEATESIWSDLRDLDIVTAAQEPQFTPLGVRESRLSQHCEVTEEASVVPCLNRTFTSAARPSHLTAEGILIPCSLPRAPPGASPYQKCPALH